MNRSRTIMHTLIGVVTFAALLVVGTASAQPAVTFTDLATNGGSMAGFLGTASTDGLPGICYQQGAKVAGPTFACFEQALKVSGLTGLVSGAAPVTVFAPTDEAFANLESAVGASSFKAFMASPSAMTTLVKDSIVKGTHTVSDLAYQASDVTGTTSVSTLSGTPLAIAFGAIPTTTDRSYVDVGSSSALAGQSYVNGPSVMFGNDSVLIPLGQITLTSLGS